MTQIESPLSTGLIGLDRLLKGLMSGDNIVWQADSVEDYQPLIEPYCRNAVASGQRVIYFRFARHKPLVDDAGLRYSRSQRYLRRMACHERTQRVE